MKIFIRLFFILMVLIIPLKGDTTTFTGGVTKVGQQESNRVIDSKTKKGIEYAKISVPQKNFHTYTDVNGNFELPDIKITQPILLNVEKEGYRPFSLTINNNESLNSPMKIEIAQSEPFDVKLDSEIIHLGDDSYSKNSASAGKFRLKSSGPSYSKDFMMLDHSKTCTNYLVIGSVCGLDTKLAKSMGQNKIKTSAYSSPAEIFFNNQKIGELKINGDGQQIKIPTNLIKTNTKNSITIKTGHNMIVMDHTDYDDIEIMNLSILSE